MPSLPGQLDYSLPTPLAHTPGQGGTHEMGNPQRCFPEASFGPGRKCSQSPLLSHPSLTSSFTWETEMGQGHGTHLQALTWEIEQNKGLHLHPGQPKYCTTSDWG